MPYLLLPQRVGVHELPGSLQELPKLDHVPQLPAGVLEWDCVCTGMPTLNIWQQRAAYLLPVLKSMPELLYV